MYLSRETAKDAGLRKVMEYTVRGWFPHVPEIRWYIKTV